MIRIEFSNKVKDTAAARAKGKCERCKLPFNGARPEYDHILPASYGGKATLINCQVICRSCHKEKTEKDMKGLRKADRQRRAGVGAEQTKQPIPARPKQSKPSSDKLPVPPPRKLFERIK